MRKYYLPPGNLAWCVMTELFWLLLAAVRTDSDFTGNFLAVAKWHLLFDLFLRRVHHVILTDWCCQPVCLSALLTAMSLWILAAVQVAVHSGDEKSSSSSDSEGSVSCFTSCMVWLVLGSDEPFNPRYFSKSTLKVKSKSELWCI